MRKIIFLFLIIFMLALSSVMASVCPQETANVSTACGGLSTGTYAFNTGGHYSNFYVNYSKPLHTMNTSVWIIKTNSSSNRTVDIPILCFNQNPIQFKWDSNIATRIASISCYNGNTWQLLFTQSYSASGCNTNNRYNPRIIDGNWNTGALPHGGPYSNWICQGNNMLYEEAILWMIEDDTDGDGVYDNSDICPNTDKNITVDNRGCPLDTDGDGVYDSNDLCPNTIKGRIVGSDGCLIKQHSTQSTIILIVLLSLIVGIGGYLIFKQKHRR